MSLFSDAEKIENSSALTEAMAIEKARFRKGRILFAAMLLLIAGVKIKKWILIRKWIK